MRLRKQESRQLSRRRLDNIVRCLEWLGFDCRGSAIFRDSHTAVQARLSLQMRFAVGTGGGLLRIGISWFTIQRLGEQALIRRG